MQKVVTGWNEMKEIRNKSGMETVPWRFNIKQYEINGRNTFDLGLTPI